MKRNKISNKIIAAGLCLAGLCATSCEDFLTVSVSYTHLTLPTICSV